MCYFVALKKKRPPLGLLTGFKSVAGSGRGGKIRNECALPGSSDAHDSNHNLTCSPGSFTDFRLDSVPGGVKIVLVRCIIVVIGNCDLINDIVLILKIIY